ncbi:MAG TPA: NTP transferase domain-containing protein, partial [Candidatus Kapabacteria bacterium]
MPTDTNLAIVILAAGQGKRMQDPTKPKVLYELADKPLVGHVLDLAKRLGAGRIITIVGFGREKVISYINDSYKGVEFAIQSEQLGTGHAVRQTQGLLDFYSGDVLILYGD